MTVGFAFCLTVSLALGHKRIFWEDEMLGWMLLRDPSFHHMVQSWNMGADGGGFTFYLLGRAWLSLFGVSEISFRLFSATCFGLAFDVLWIAARRFYRLEIVAFSLFVCWFVSPTFVVHMAEGRFYGLLVLGTAIIIWLVMTMCQADRTGAVKTPAKLYLLMFLSHGFLTTSHLLGIVYSGVLLLALIALDWRAGRFRPLLYASASLAWLLLIPERKAIVASIAVGKPWFWTVTPDLKLFLAAFVGFSSVILLMLLTLGILVLITLRRKGERPRQALQRGARQRTSVYVVTIALLMVPISFATQALLGGTSLFTSRYLTPVLIAQVLLSMELMCLIDWSFVFPGRAPMLLSSRIVSAAGVFLAVFLPVWILVDLKGQALGAPEYTSKLSKRLPTGIPVLCEDAWSFVDLISRQHNSGIPYTYLLDWDYSTSRLTPRLEVTQYHLMENWKKVGYFSGSVRYRNEFLRDEKVFLILNPKQFPKDRTGWVIGNPLLARFAATPGYQVRNLSIGKNTKTKNYGVAEDYDVWLVCRAQCPAGPISTWHPARP